MGEGQEFKVNLGYMRPHLKNNNYKKENWIICLNYSVSVGGTCQFEYLPQERIVGGSILRCMFIITLTVK